VTEPVYTSVSTPDSTKETAQNPFSAAAIKQAHHEGLEPNLRRQLAFIGMHDHAWRGLEIEVLGATNPTLSFWRNWPCPDFLDRFVKLPALQPRAAASRWA
jgi:hypothetical protein